VIGFLSSESPGEFAHLLAAFRQGLSQTGYVEHRNVGIEYGWAEGQPEQRKFSALLNMLRAGVT